MELLIFNGEKVIGVIKVDEELLKDDLFGIITVDIDNKEIQTLYVKGLGYCMVISDETAERIRTTIYK